MLLPLPFTTLIIMDFSLFVSVFVKFYFLLTPFFILSVFLAVTENESRRSQRHLAIRITLGVIVISLILLLFGNLIFAMLGITVDAFRIGAGALLFLSAISLTKGEIQLPSAKRTVMDLAIVPLAIPMTLGPGSVGALLVLGSRTEGISVTLSTSLGIVAASFCVGLMLYLSNPIKRLLGSNGIAMLSKLTGLVLAALSAQMVFTGAAAFLK